MSLPQFQNDDTAFQMLQNTWATQLNPVLANPTTNPLILKNIVLVNGTNVINHRLSRKMQGFIICDIDAPAVIYRSEPFNSLTLTLTSNASATVTLAVF